jgi:hypothetical protein
MNSNSYNEYFMTCVEAFPISQVCLQHLDYAWQAALEHPFLAVAGTPPSLSAQAPCTQKSIKKTVLALLQMYQSFSNDGHAVSVE